MDLHTHNLQLTLEGMNVLQSLLLSSKFLILFSEGNLATKQVIFLQRPVMWNSAVQTPEVSKKFMVLILHVMVRYRNKPDFKINGGKSGRRGFHLKQVKGFSQLNLCYCFSQPYAS